MSGTASRPRYAAVSCSLWPSATSPASVAIARVTEPGGRAGGAGVVPSGDAAVDLPARTRSHPPHQRPVPRLRMYRSRLVPRLIPAIGLVGAPLILASAHRHHRRRRGPLHDPSRGGSADRRVGVRPRRLPEPSRGFRPVAAPRHRRLRTHDRGSVAPPTGSRSCFPGAGPRHRRGPPLGVEVARWTAGSEAQQGRPAAWG